MHTSSIIPIGHKPLIRSLTGADVESLFVLPVQGERFVSLYITEIQAQVMLRVNGSQAKWEGAWAPISKEAAIDVARKEAFNDGLPQGRSLFYILDETTPDLLRSMYGDDDAASDCLDCSALNRHVDGGEDCLVVLYEPMEREVQTFRIRDYAIAWWYKSRPHKRAEAIRMSAGWRVKYRMTMDQLHFYDVNRVSA